MCAGAGVACGSRRMSEFQEADARLAEMHGYVPTPEYGEPQTVAERLIRLEAKLDRLMQALSAGAVGDWR
jgi:hypothetical protein